MIPHHPGHIVIELDQWRSLLQQSVCVRVHNAIDHSISILIIIIDNIDLHTHWIRIFQTTQQQSNGSLIDNDHYDQALWTSHYNKW